MLNALRPRPALTREEAAGIRLWIRVNCEVGNDFEWKLLPSEDHAELAALVRTVASDGGGADWTKLGRRQTRRLESLLAVGAGHPPDFFDLRRHEADVMRQFKELDVKSRRRNPLKRRQEMDWFQVMHAKLASGHLFVSHVSILTYVVAVLQTGKPLGPTQAIEGNGDDAVLAFDQSWSIIPGAIDGEDSLMRWRIQVEWLAEHDWLTLRRTGPTWRVGLGKATLVALRHGQVAA